MIKIGEYIDKIKFVNYDKLKEKRKNEICNIMCETVINYLVIPYLLELPKTERNCLYKMLLKT